MTWVNKQVSADGWRFLFESLAVDDLQSADYQMHGLDNMQRAYWGDFGTTGILPDGAAENIASLLAPLVAMQGAFSPLIHEAERGAWQGWSERVAAMLAVQNRGDLTGEEKAILISGEATQGFPISGVQESIPAVVLPFILLRASKARFAADWRDKLDTAVLSIVAGPAAAIGLEALEWATREANETERQLKLWAVGAAVGLLAVGLFLVSRDDA